MRHLRVSNRVPDVPQLRIRQRWFASLLCESILPAAGNDLACPDADYLV